MPKNRAYFVLRVLDGDGGATRRQQQQASDTQQKSQPDGATKKSQSQKQTQGQDGDENSKQGKNENQQTGRKVEDPPVATTAATATGKGKCFGIVGSTFLSRGTTMDAELYATHLPDAVMLPTATTAGGTGSSGKSSPATVSAEGYGGVRAVVHIESIEEEMILSDARPLHIFMVRRPAPLYGNARCCLAHDRSRESSSAHPDQRKLKRFG